MASVELYNENGHRCLAFTGLAKGEGIPSNQFLVVDDNHAALIDPGGDLTYVPLSAALVRYIDLPLLDLVITSHQDPDVIASLPRWMKFSSCKVAVSSLWARFLPHLVPEYDHVSVRDRMIEIPDAGTRLQLGRGFIRALPAHFLHSPGNFSFLDESSGILFSGDVGSCAGLHWVSDASHDEMKMEMRVFHERYMASGSALRLWVSMVREIKPRLIVPQHGPPIPAEKTEEFLDWLWNLRCGVDLLNGGMYGLNEPGITLEDGTSLSEDPRAAQHRLELDNQKLRDLLGFEKIRRMNVEQTLLAMQRSVAIGEVVGSIAHQWRQPINSMALLLQDLKQAFEFGELDAAYMADSTKQMSDLLNEMSRTVDDFRSYFRADKEPVAFNVRDQIERVLGLVGASLRSANVSVVRDLDETCVASGYPNELAQALLNILNNARDVIQERKVPNGTVWIRLFRDGDDLVVTIADNGGGIQANPIEQIFESSYSSKQGTMGTGLGLSIARKIVVGHLCGDLTARNTNIGAEFRITLPLTKVAK